MPRKCLVEKEERCNPVRLERKQGERQKYIFYFYSLFVGNVICFILNGYRKRAVCRKHKVEPGNWSFDPSGLLQLSPFPDFPLSFFISTLGCQYLKS